MPKNLVYLAFYLIVTGGESRINITVLSLFHSYITVYTNSLLANLNARAGLRRKLGHIHMTVLKEIDVTIVSPQKQVVAY